MAVSLVQLDALAERLTGRLHTDRMHRRLYATDASVYRSLPLAVAEPANVEDVRQLVRFANDHGTSLIPRAAGTSLAGQCVGDGIVVDVSKHFNGIGSIDVEQGWVDVQPGVVRDDLNRHLAAHGLFFAPETSTANRAMIGGMVGNNSCGANSIVYGSTRDHVLEMDVVLADGRTATVRPGATDDALAGIDRALCDLLADDALRTEIASSFPKPTVTRRNTGYALDALLDRMDLCKLLCGSEGTLAFTTRIRLNLEPLPPPHVRLLCPHFTSVDEALRAVQVVMQHDLQRCELMDRTIMDCTRDHPEYGAYRFFLHGDPDAVLMLEIRADSEDAVEERADSVRRALEGAGLGHACPMVRGPDIDMVWKLRKAGLGLLANMPGDAKAVACIEDTAVAVADLPAYIRSVERLMAEYDQKAVYYAHAGAGELHLRPILDLKRSDDVQMFEEITRRTADLVTRFGGAMSGEHGDGRVRAPVLPDLVGPVVYEAFRTVKRIWDPHGILNPGKIVDPAPMTDDLRYAADRPHEEPTTRLRFDDSRGMLRMAEKCNGSGDCRKSAAAGGTMCPSYMATRDERDTTRARANMLREFLTGRDPVDPAEVDAALDLCLSCKGCTAECPSSVDMTALKAEWMHRRHQEDGVPLRHRLFGHNARINRLASLAPAVHNAVADTAVFKRSVGVHPERSMPHLAPRTFRRAFRQHRRRHPAPDGPAVVLFVDEFTQFYDVAQGMAVVRLLDRLGYDVRVVDHTESGRALLSKGFLNDAGRVVDANVRALADVVGPDRPLVGIEPSAVLGFRDEYRRLVSDDLRDDLERIQPHVHLLDEWFAAEVRSGRIDANRFQRTDRVIHLHGHCHQKALSDVDATRRILDLIGTCRVIPSGCCGMAGSFGYEREHYDVSMQIGELVLFPAVRAAGDDEICAVGTSCRHQIADGTGRDARHWAEMLEETLEN